MKLKTCKQDAVGGAGMYHFLCYIWVALGMARVAKNH